jgi:hypothetical protein
MPNSENKIRDGIESVKIRFDKLKLSDDQAENILLFEAEQSGLPPGNYLYPWEQDDYELDVFERILDKKQMQEWLKTKSHEITQRIDHYNKINEERKQFILVQEKSNEWLDNHLRSTAFKNEFLNYRVILGDSKVKIEFLTAEYQLALKVHKTAIIKRHYREYKRYAPAILQLEMLKHAADAIFPSYSLFSDYADTETIAIADTLIGKYSFIAERHQKYFDSAKNEFANYYKKIKKKHVVEKKGGWYYNINTSAENQLKEKVFPILLICV